MLRVRGTEWGERRGRELREIDFLSNTMTCSKVECGTGCTYLGICEKAPNCVSSVGELIVWYVAYITTKLFLKEKVEWAKGLFPNFKKQIQ